MAQEPLVIITQLVGFSVCLWLGLYLLARATHRTPLIVVGMVALFAQAAFFGASVLTFTTHNLGMLTLLERSFWWSAVVPATAWFHFCALVAQQVVERRADDSIWSPLVLIVYGVAALIIVLGTSTDVFIVYSQPIVATAERYAYLERGPAYPLQIAFLGLTTTGAAFNLVRALRRLSQSQEPRLHTLAQPLKLLVAGAVLFVVGALYISSRFNWNPAISVLPGYLCLFVAIAALSYGIANFGLLLEGKSVRRDFFYNLTGISLITLLYVGLLSLTGWLSTPGLLALVGLVIVTHMLVDRGRSILDKLFFSQAEQVARAEARDYATDLGTAPVVPPTLTAEDPLASGLQPLEAAPEAAAPTDEKAFKNLVRKALTALKSPPQLAKSPLLALKLVEQRVAQAGYEDNRLNRVSALRELLIEQIEGLRPKDSSSLPTGDAWRFYNVLYYPYVRELSRKGALAEARRMEKERQRSGRREPDELEQVLHWLADIDEDTFYKWQRRASDMIAATVWEENEKCSPPPAAPATAEASLVR